MGNVFVHLVDIAKAVLNGNKLLRLFLERDKQQACIKLPCFRINTAGIREGTS